MTMKLCSECHERTVFGRGLCSRCYQRARKAGTLPPPPLGNWRYHNLAKTRTPEARRQAHETAGHALALPPPSNVTEKDLRTAYIVNGWSLAKVAETMSEKTGRKYYPYHVSRWLDHYGIPRRTHQESQQLRQWGTL